MHGLGILGSLVVVLAAAAVASVLLGRLRAPLIVGFLAAGVVIGPFGLGLVAHAERIEGLAELGVMLLLFSIGLEVSPQRLWALRMPGLVGGGLQVVLTVAAAAGVAWALDLPLEGAVVVGFVAAVSSTAIVMRSLAERRELDAPHGRLAMAFLLFQDLAVVPMILAVPLLGDGGLGDVSVWRLALKAALLVGGVLFLARRGIPWFLDRVADVRSREAFLLALAVILLGAVWISAQAGLSMALGAFLAGVLIGTSEHKLVALSEAIPFRDLFTALFFVSVGMLLDLPALLAHPLPPLLVAGTIFVGKALLVAVLVLLLGYPTRTALITGLSLGQIGEFSFLLLVLAARHGVLPPDVHQTLVSAAILSMFATPLAIAAAPRVGGLFGGGPSRWRRAPGPRAPRWRRAT